jgi:hypothetical protein
VLSQKRDYPNILIVEGVDDKHSVIGLMKDHTNWPVERRLWPVWVEVGNSVDQILAAGYLTTEIKASNAKTVGVMLDADIQMAGLRGIVWVKNADFEPETPLPIRPGKGPDRN